MNFRPGPIKPLGEDVEDFMNSRIPSCSYYNSIEYHENRKRSQELSHKIRKYLGERMWKEIYNYSFEKETLEGELHARLSESCYRLGFNDALQLVNQLNEAGKGHLNIFN